MADNPNPIERLKQALDTDEFLLYCQPILALAGPERYPMAEVLVRLHTEEVNLMPPGEFLPTFEHYRMMPQLDRWVVRNVAKFRSRIASAPRLSVNLSAQTLDDAEFCGFVDKTMIDAGIESNAVLFEIEEGDALARMGATARFCARLREIGSSVLIDGFRCTPASLTLLKVLHVEFIKVDGALIGRLRSDPIARKQVNIILRLAKAVGFGVLAANVEKREALVRLEKLGFDYAQGFGIRHPHPLESIAEVGQRLA